MSFLIGQFSFVIFSVRFPSQASENQFQAQLNLAHFRGSSGNSPCIGIQGPSRIRKDIIVGCTKVRMVQEVEKLSPKLEVLPLPDPIVLRERKIQIELSRPDHCISS